MLCPNKLCQNCHPWWMPKSQGQLTISYMIWQTVFLFSFYLSMWLDRNIMMWTRSYLMINLICHKKLILVTSIIHFVNFFLTSMILIISSGANLCWYSILISSLSWWALALHSSTADFLIVDPSVLEVCMIFRRIFVILSPLLSSSILLF